MLVFGGKCTSINQLGEAVRNMELQLKILSTSWTLQANMALTVCLSKVGILVGMETGSLTATFLVSLKIMMTLISTH